MHELENFLIIFIRNIEETYKKQTMIFKLSFDNFTQNDEKEFTEYVKKNFYKMSFKSKKQLLSNAKNYISIVSRDGLYDIFDFLELNESEDAEKIKNSSLPKTDYIVHFTDPSDEKIKELLNSELYTFLKDCNSFNKLLTIFNDYLTYEKNVICEFNRQLCFYVNNFIDNINIKNLNNELKIQDLECSDVVDNIIELHERRNIIEHHNKLITHEYIKKVGKDCKNLKEGDYLITSPEYIHKSYFNVINYAIIFTKYYAKQNSLTVDKEYLIENIKNKDKNIFDFI